MFKLHNENVVSFIFVHCVVFVGLHFFKNPAAALNNYKVKDTDDISCCIKNRSAMQHFLKEEMFRSSTT